MENNLEIGKLICKNSSHRKSYHIGSIINDIKLCLIGHKKTLNIFNSLAVSTVLSERKKVHCILGTNTTRRTTRVYYNEYVKCVKIRNLNNLAKSKNRKHFSGVVMLILALVMYVPFWSPTLVPQGVSTTCLTGGHNWEVQLPQQSSYVESAPAADTVIPSHQMSHI